MKTNLVKTNQVVYRSLCGTQISQSNKISQCLEKTSTDYNKISMKQDSHPVQSNKWQMVCKYKLKFLTHFLSPQLTQRSQWCFTFNGRKQPVKRLCFNFSNVTLLKKHKFSVSIPSFTKLFYHRLHIISAFKLY